MAQNLIVTNGLSAHPSKSIETSKRPVLIEFSKGGGGVIPKLIQAQVSVKYTVDGSTFITEDVGKPIIQGRNWDSSASNPVFTFDIAPILDAFIYKKIDCFEEVDSVTDDSYPVSGYAKGIIVDYTVKAQEWSTVSEVLTLNLDAAVETPVAKVFSGYVKDDVVLNNKFSNCQAKANYFENATWFVNDTLIGTIPSKTSLLTNCPESLSRKIPLGSPLVISSLLQSNANAELAIHYVRDNQSSYTSEMVHSVYANSTTDILMSNLNISNSGLFSILNDGTIALLGSASFSVNLFDASTYGKKLKFNIVERGNNSSNPNFGVTNSESTLIYFYNDFGVLDFYLFEGFTNVSHENSITSFNISAKDYTKRSSHRSVTSSASTTEIITCSAIVNQETSSWLSEIFRSRGVFVYEKNEFVSISVLEGDTTPLSSSRKPSIFELSFIKNIHNINY